MKDNEEVLCPTCRKRILSRARNANNHSHDMGVFQLLQRLERDMNQMKTIIEAKAMEEYV